MLGVSLGTGGSGVHVSTGDAASSSRASGRDGRTPNRDGGIRVELRMDAERTARMVAGLRHRGLRLSYTERTTTDCVPHAHGQVARFLREHPCVAMYRTLLIITDLDLDLGTVLLAVARVQMPSESSAAALKTLIDRPGSGNITELSRERGPYRNVRFTGQFYRSDLTELVNESVT